ncbi:diguanylate cyclase [Burkholderia sp. S171]|uniref:sensor domain-containing diguanylate cyclase n=1 Tax=Burkholderia sp. S171 TaxID=1641860 RepID=UPI00131DF9D4|nr:diguanylate cyclase [Burkholderia sp. S171]
MNPASPSATGLRKRRIRPRWTAVGMASALSRHPMVAGVVGTVVAVLMASLSIGTLYQGRQGVLDHAHETSANLVAIISSDLARNVEIYNLSLNAMVEGAQNPAMTALSPTLRNQILFDRATSAAYITGAYVLDAHGKVTAASKDVPLLAGSFADREYFYAQQRSPSTGLFFSHPFASRVRGTSTIGMSRRINAPDGSFAGIALLAMNVAYFNSLLDKLNVGAEGSIFVIHQDGTMIARKPFRETLVGRNVAGSPTFPRMVNATSGSYAANSPVDGVRRLYTFSRVPGTPFIAVVAPAEEDVLEPWRERSRIVAALTLLSGLSFVAVSWLLALSLRERARAQEELVRLAGTDALTGLPNRRAFDERMDDEWRRGRRAGTPLSVLFIDVDYFKAYNDTYGHALGDDALATVAHSIATAVRRPGDVPARYGGEEFVVLLPDTPLEGAQHIAEAIRLRVQACAIPHRASALGTVTVSIGCATASPPGLGGAYGLLGAADQQLYKAKAAGRDCVRPLALAGAPVASL